MKFRVRNHQLTRDFIAVTAGAMRMTEYPIFDRRTGPSKFIREIHDEAKALSAAFIPRIVRVRIWKCRACHDYF